MAIQETVNGVTKTYRYYPYDRIEVGGRQVREVWLNGAKYYPEELPPAMDIYEQSYSYSFEDKSDDGHAYLSAHALGHAYGRLHTEQVDNITVTGTIRYYIPQGGSLADYALSETIYGGGVCYAHNVHTVTCNIPDSMRSIYGGLEVDLSAQFATGYTYSDAYRRRLENGITVHSVLSSGLRQAFVESGVFGYMAGGVLGTYLQKYGSTAIFLMACVRDFNSFSGYQEPQMEIWSNATYRGTEITRELLEAINRHYQ